MTQMFQCGDNPALVGYLYGECEPGERRAIDEHLVVCPACAAELEALGATRQQLAAWTPPEAQLDFQIVRAQPRAERPEPGAGSSSRWLGAWWTSPMPAWAQMAAAVVVFGVGLSLGVSGIGNRGSGFGFESRIATPDSRVASAPAVAQTRAASVNDLAALEQRLRAEMAQMRSAATPREVSTTSASDADIMTRVRALIDESEQRQQRELALRTAQVARDFESQRRLDMQNVRSIVGQVEGTTGAEIARQQQTLQYLMRVSQQR